jgi:hypothetical protein
VVLRGASKVEVCEIEEEQVVVVATQGTVTFTLSSPLLRLTIPEYDSLYALDIQINHHSQYQPTFDALSHFAGNLHYHEGPTFTGKFWEYFLLNSQWKNTGEKRLSW